MKRFSLKFKILLLIFSISLICPIVSTYIIFNNSKVVDQYNQIAQISLPRTREMGEILFKFRQVRIQFRSLAILGNSSKDKEIYLERIDKSLAEFTEAKNDLLKTFNKSEEEINMAKNVEAGWKRFFAFGGEVLALLKIGDEISMNKMADLIRYKCPEESADFENSVQKMISWQDEKAVERTTLAISATEKSNWISSVLAIVGMIFALLFGGWFAKHLSDKLAASVSILDASSNNINYKSNEVASLSQDLSDSSQQQSSNLQDAVSSINEISSMISRNADSATSSREISDTCQPPKSEQLFLFFSLS